MKWRDADFKSGIEKIKAVLIYGQDAGLVDEYRRPKLGYYAVKEVYKNMKEKNKWKTL